MIADCNHRSASDDEQKPPNPTSADLKRVPSIRLSRDNKSQLNVYSSSMKVHQNRSKLNGCGHRNIKSNAEHKESVIHEIRPPPTKKELLLLKSFFGSSPWPNGNAVFAQRDISWFQGLAPYFYFPD